jgi:hypothetical protein
LCPEPIRRTIAIVSGEGGVMMRIAALLIAALATWLSPSPASAQESKPTAVLESWRRVGPWTVWVVRVDRYCVLSSTTSGPEMFFGYGKTRVLNMGLTHPAWRSLEVGKTYPMTVQIDEQSHPGAMNAWMRPNGASVVIGRDFDDEEQGRRFLRDFQRGSQLTVIYEGKRLASYALQASQMAGDELLRCQAEQDKIADSDPFKPKTGGGPASDKAGPARDAAPPQASTLPKLSPEQRVEAIRLAANLLTRLPGFRILGEEEQKAIDPKMAALEPAVVWRTDGAMGLLHLFPNVTEAQVPRIAAGLLGGVAEDCAGEFTGTIVPDVRSPSVRRVHASCAQGNGTVLRMILMPFKGGVYYLSTSGTTKDNAAVQRTEELLRNALFEVMPR